jgi:hypothetical protein
LNLARPTTLARNQNPEDQGRQHNIWELAALLANQNFDSRSNLKNVAIRWKFGFWLGNKALIESCLDVSGNKNLHVNNASIFILRKMWERLQETNSLRVVE